MSLELLIEEYEIISCESAKNKNGYTQAFVQWLYDHEEKKIIRSKYGSTDKK